jgi:hypothetical protein
MALLKKYWGFVALIAAIGGWVALIAGNQASSAVAVILILSAAALGYFLFQAPLLWCGAMTRGEEFCRNNCSGLLMGCYLRQHKWQKIQMAFRPKKWAELNRVLWKGARRVWATVSGLVAIISTVVALVTYFSQHL